MADLKKKGPEMQLLRRMDFAMFALVLSAIAPFAWASASATASTSQSESASLNLGYDVFTKESIVEINGKKFRKVEYRSDVVYLQILGDDTNSDSDLRVMCEESGASKIQMPQQVLVAVKVTKRTSLFVDGLRKVCANEGRGQKVVLDPALRVGFLIDDKDPKALLKNKKIFINPLGGAGVGFSADW